MMGDINSQIGGCLLGRDSVAELAGRFGTDTFRRAIIDDLESIGSRSTRCHRRSARRHLYGRGNARQ